MSVETLEQAIVGTKKIVANVSTDQLEGPTPCASWDVRRLINHIVGGANWFATTMETGVGPVGEDDVEPDVTGGDIGAAYDEATERAVAAFKAPGAMDKV